MLWYVIERNLILVNNAIGDYTTQFILVCYNAFRRFKQKYNLMQTSVEKFAPRLSKIKTQTIKCVNVFIRSYKLIVLVFVKNVEVHHLQIRIAIISEDIDLYFIDTQIKYAFILKQSLNVPRWGLNSWPFDLESPTQPSELQCFG